MGFLSVMPLIPQGRFPSFDSTAYIFIADGILAGRVPYVDLWENKGLPLYFLNIVGRMMTPGGYTGIWLLELGFMSLMFGCFLWTLRGFVSGAALVLPTVLLTLGIVMTSVGGNTPEFWNMALQSGGLLAAWFIIRGEGWTRRGQMALVGFSAGMASMTKLNLLGTWVAIFMLIIGLVVAKRLAVAESLRVLGVMAAGFVVAVVLSVAPVIAWGATHEWWDQTIGFGLSFAGGVTGETRLLALLTGISKIAFISWPLLLAFISIPIAWSVRKRPRIQTDRAWMIAFLVLWLGIEVTASLASGMAFTHYYMPWLIPASMLIGLLWDVKRWSIPVLLIPATAALLGVVRVLPILDAKLNLHRGFPPVVVAERKYYKRAQKIMIEEVEARTTPEDTIFIWGLDLVVFNETGRLSAGPYGHPLTTLVIPGYQSKRMLDELVSRLEADPPKLIIDSTHIRPGWPSLWDLRTKEPIQLKEGRVMPYMHVLPDFVERNYTLVVTRKPHVEYYVLKAE